jgi:hypothetical protein
MNRPTYRVAEGCKSRPASATSRKLTRWRLPECWPSASRWMLLGATTLTKGSVPVCDHIPTCTVAPPLSAWRLKSTCCSSCTFVSATFCIGYISSVVAAPVAGSVETGATKSMSAKVSLPTTLTATPSALVAERAVSWEASVAPV